MAVLYTAFNTLSVKFNEELIIVFPNDLDFKVCLNTITLMNKTNKKKLFELVSPQLVLYNKYIKEKDERFFLEKNEEDYTREKNDVVIISKLKKYWTSLSENNKEKIWEYINSLLSIIEKIIQSNLK